MKLSNGDEVDDDITTNTGKDDDSVKEVLVRRRCRDCGIPTAGIVRENDFRRRKCPRKGCNGDMEEIYRGKP